MGKVKSYFLIFLLSLQCHLCAINEAPNNNSLSYRIEYMWDKVSAWLEAHQGKIIKAVSALVGFYAGVWYYKNYMNPFRKKINIGVSECRGDAAQYNECRVVQLVVKNQYDNDGGGSASCAYHSIRNAEEIAHALNRNIKNLDNRLHNAQDIQSLFGQEGAWREAIIERRVAFEERKDSEWLHSAEIEYLMRYIVQANAFHCIDDINLLGLQRNAYHSARIDESHIDYIIPAVRKDLEKPGEYIHKFFINTAAQDSLQNKGHWFVVILHKAANGVLKFIIADSLNHKRTNDWRVKKLIDAIKKPHI